MTNTSTQNEIQIVATAVPYEFNGSKKDGQQLVHIFPREKEWYGVNGRGPFRLNNIDAVLSASNQPKNLDRAYVDREHQTQLAPKGTPIKAAGWFKEFIYENGAIYGRVEWTPQGLQELKDKEFRFFSAVFYVDKNTREITRITGGTLTNIPNFTELEAIASQQEQPCEKETKIMDEEMKKLAKALGLDADKSESDVVIASAVETIQAGATATAEIASIKTGLNLKDDATVEEVIASASQEAGYDAAKFVPMETYQELASQVKDMRQEKISEEIASAIEDGKLAPAQKSWAEEYASQDFEGFKKFIEKQPNVFTETASQKSQDSEEQSLSKEEAEIASQLGLTAEEFLGTQAED